MFIKGRKKSSYTLSESNVSNNINKDVLIKSTSSRSSSKNFELDLNPTFSEQCKSIVKIEAFKDLIQETSLLKENTKVQNVTEKNGNYYKKKVNMKRSSSKIILFNKQKQTNNIIQRFIKHLSCTDLLKTKLTEGYYYVPWSPGDPKLKMLQDSLSQSQSEMSKTKSTSESNISSILKDLNKIENLNYNDIFELSKNHEKPIKYEGNKRQFSSTTTENKTSSSCSYSKEDLKTSKSDGEHLKDNSKSSGSRSYFKIKKITVKIENRQFEERGMVVDSLNEQLEEESLNFKTVDLPIPKQVIIETKETAPVLKMPKKLKKNKKLKKTESSLSPVSSLSSLDLANINIKKQHSKSPIRLTKSQSPERNFITSRSSIIKSKTSFMKLFNINNQLTSSSKSNYRPSNLFYLNDQPENCNIEETQKMYEHWALNPGYGRNLDNWEIRCGMHDWGLWRSKINNYLSLTSVFTSINDFLAEKKSPESLKFGKTPLSFDMMNNFKIEPCLARFIYYYGWSRDSPSLDPDSYMFYGIPRARLISSPNNSIKNVNQVRNPLESETTEKYNVITGINVKKKVKEFEHKSQTSRNSSIDRKIELTKKTELDGNKLNAETFVIAKAASAEISETSNQSLTELNQNVINHTETKLDHEKNEEVAGDQENEILIPLDTKEISPNSTSSKKSSLRESFFKNIIRTAKQMNDIDIAKRTSIIEPDTLKNLGTKTDDKKKTQKNYHSRYYCPRHKRFHQNIISKKRCTAKPEKPSHVTVPPTLKKSSKEPSKQKQDSFKSIKSSSHRKVLSTRPTSTDSDSSIINNKTLRKSEIPIIHKNSKQVETEVAFVTNENEKKSNSEQNLNNPKMKKPPRQTVSITPNSKKRINQKMNKFEYLKPPARAPQVNASVPPPLPIPPPPSLPKFLQPSSNSLNDLNKKDNIKQQLAIATNSANNLRENHRNLSKILPPYRPPAHRAPPPIPTGKKSVSQPRLSKLTSASNSRVCECKMNKNVSDETETQAKTSQLTNILKHKNDASKPPSLRIPSSSKLTNETSPMKSSRNTITSSSSERSFTGRSLSQTDNMNLIRESTKAKLMFMNQKIATEKLLNRTIKNGAVKSTPPVSPKSPRFSGLRHEYEFDYENEIGTWFSDKSSSVFDTKINSSNQSSNIEFQSSNVEVNEKSRDAEESTSGWSYLSTNRSKKNVDQRSASNLKSMLPKPKTSKEILKEIVRLTNNTHSKNPGPEQRSHRPQTKSNTLNRKK